MTAIQGQVEPFLRAVAERAAAAGVFGEVRSEGGRVSCAAKDAAAEAFYRVEAEPAGVYVSLVMADRWLSESIESDLMHTGDSMEELLEEELVELDYPHPTPKVEHYRSDDRLFTFRSRVPVEAADSQQNVEVVIKALLAYEACFRNLGDMEAGEE